MVGSVTARNSGDAGKTVGHCGEFGMTDATIGSDFRFFDSAPLRSE